MRSPLPSLGFELLDPGVQRRPANQMPAAETEVGDSGKACDSAVQQTAEVADAAPHDQSAFPRTQISGSKSRLVGWTMSADYAAENFRQTSARPAIRLNPLYLFEN